jgi:HAMP domain-containing protein
VELAPQTIVTLGLAVAGVASTWGALSRRIRALEDRADEIKALRDQITALEASRMDQGRRIGELDKTTHALVGELRGVSIGLAAARRTRTAAGGHKIGGGE